MFEKQAEQLIQGVMRGLGVNPQEVIALVGEWDRRFRQLETEVSGFKAAFQLTVSHFNDRCERLEGLLIDIRGQLDAARETAVVPITPLNGKGNDHV